MSTQKKKPVELKKGHVNLLAPESGYTIDTGVGPIVEYHGRIVDLRNCSPALAAQMAEDKDARWIKAKEAAPKAPAPGAGNAGK